MNKIQIEIKSRKVSVKEKRGVKSWDFEIEVDWKEELKEFLEKTRMKGEVELYLGEEHFITKRINLYSNENIRERIEEELEDEIERKAYRWIRLEKNKENSEYIAIFINVRELERIKEFFKDTGNRLTLLSPAFARDKNINFITKKKKWIFLVPALLLIEVFSFFVLKEFEREIKIEKNQFRGRREEIKKIADRLAEEIKEYREEKKSDDGEREISKIPLILEIIRSIPEEVYLESWEIDKNRMKLKGTGDRKQLYIFERIVSRKRGVSWTEIEYIKKQERGYLFSMEISL